MNADPGYVASLQVDLPRMHTSADVEIATVELAPEGVREPNRLLWWRRISLYRIDQSVGQVNASEPYLLPVQT